jgi:hypothetical protein
MLLSKVTVPAQLLRVLGSDSRSAGEDTGVEKKLWQRKPRGFHLHCWFFLCTCRLSPQFTGAAFRSQGLQCHRVIAEDESPDYNKEKSHDTPKETNAQDP